MTSAPTTADRTLGLRRTQTTEMQRRKHGRFDACSRTVSGWVSGELVWIIIPD